MQSIIAEQTYLKSCAAGLVQVAGCERHQMSMSAFTWVQSIRKGLLWLTNLWVGNVREACWLCLILCVQVHSMAKVAATHQ